MHLRTTAAVLAVLLGSALATRAGGPDTEDWGDYGAPSWDVGAGSFVHTKKTTTASGPGVSNPPMVIETKVSVTSVDDEFRMFLTENRDGEGPWRIQDEVRVPRKRAADPPKAEPTSTEDLGEETLVVDGQEYACAKRKRTWETVTVTTWTHADQGLLKSESVSSDQRETWAVTKFSMKATVAGRELTCRETKNVSLGADAGLMDTETTLLLSDAVPGRMARMERISRAQGASLREVVEIVAFEKK